jgi:two-component system chemotaxis sensor kinase CheA
MSVRMTPVSVLTQRLPRVVRDLARRAGKRAVLEVEGEDQQLDRAIIEGLDAPLTHMVTNAIEHGIESPDERAAAGKPAIGQLFLTCERVRDEIVVTLTDDGGGVDIECLVNAAVTAGLLDRARAEAMAERDLIRLVGMPGLTAREEADAHAGRGVGMDAVVESVGALGGRVEMTTERGAGSTVRLRLPRTPGISRLLLVEADRQVFGLPLGGIVRTDVFGPEDVEREGGVEFVSHGEQRYRLHRLRHLLGLPGESADRRFPGVVFTRGEHPFVVGVDRVVGQQDSVIKPLGPLLERIEGLQGVTIDTVGHPVFVVDVTRFAVVS